MDSALMILFTAPTEITPDPAPSLVMNYDSSCLPIPTTPTPAPTPVSPQDEDESGWLGNIPPREGGIGLMENNITLQQTTPVFLIVDTTADDGTLKQCANAEGDCSLRGAVQYASDRVNEGSMNHHVIILPNNTYGLTDELQIRGYVTIVGEDAYSSNPMMARVIIQRTSSIERPLFSLYYINNTTHSEINLYNLTFQNNYTFVGGAIEIHSSKVGIYNSQFLNNSAKWGGAISIDTQPIPESIRSTVKIVNRTFRRNRAESLGGALITPSGASITKVSCSTFANNSSDNGGGAIGATSYLGFTGQIIVTKSNFINNTIKQSPAYSPNGGGAIHRTGGTVAISGNYWIPNNPPLTTYNGINSVWGVSVGTVADDFVEANECVGEIPPPPNPVRQCSDPNDFSKLTEENTNLADREACWRRYEAIIYLTIYHEFSMDNKLVFTPKTISDTTSFDITQYEYEGIVGTIGLDSRDITSDELIPLRAYDSPYNPYYTFARAILNGMRNVVNPNALINPAQIPNPPTTSTYDNPMRYFPNSYLYTVAAVTYQNDGWVDNWLFSCSNSEDDRDNVEITLNGVPQIVPICKNFCAGEFLSQDLPRRNTSIVCNSEEWFATQPQDDKFAYDIVMPEVRNAIHDMIYRPQNEPVWLSAIYSVVPANRAPIQLGDTLVATVDGVGNFLNSAGQSCFGAVKLGNVGQSYIFNTPPGYLWDLTWKFYPSICNPNNPNDQVFYSEDIWDQEEGGFVDITDYPNSCLNVNETLPQAYMRHLRETYGDNFNTSTFNRILRGEPINLLTNEQVRFGMANRSVRMPVLGLEFPEPLEPQTPTPEPPSPTPTTDPNTPKPRISGIVWYTYNFNIGNTTEIDDFPDKTTIPVTEFEFVVYDANQNIITPLVCP